MTTQRTFSMRRSARVLIAVALLAGIMAVATLPAGPAHATFSGTNGRITFGRYDPAIDDFHIYAANPDGSHEVQLTTVPSEVSDWSPDGTRIAFDFLDGQTVQIATMNPDGTGVVQLTHEENVFHGEPAWSPDGTRLAFESGSANRDGVDIMDASTGTVLSQVTTNPFGGFDGVPQWSPNGDWIAFTRAKATNLKLVTAVFLVHPDGTGLYQLTPWGMRAANPDWSPDGTKIAFEGKGAVPAPSRIFTIHPDGSGLTDLVKTTGSADFHDPSWSPDGTKLIFQGWLFGPTPIPPHPPRVRALWMVNADGSDLHMLPTAGQELDFPDWGTAPLEQ
jgi:Tol biopolymer transport system component